MIIKPSNLLILDEPTNHLDIPSKQMLEQALSNYNGTALIVSHDRYFISKVANKIVEIRDGQLINCLLYTSPSPRDQRGSRMPSSA